MLDPSSTAEDTPGEQDAVGLAPAAITSRVLSLHVRKRQPYNTTSNRRRVVKTPSEKLIYHHLKKIALSPKCGECGVGLPISLPCVPANRPSSPSARRLYAGHMMPRSHNPLSILRAFLVEAGIVKVFKSQQRK
ncbi:hypothetical protein C8R44DRAFT_988310 [Mycena epipterygia]|nr:hypothetical protein C8R44DRAFT_988310 [Mycena epipterygia]